jgi:hypothetical protein
MRNMSEMWLSYSKSCTCLHMYHSLFNHQVCTLNNDYHSAWPGRNMHAQTETGNNSTAWQRFSGIDRQIQHRRDSCSCTARKEQPAQLGIGFHVLTGKYSKEGTVNDAQAGKESTALTEINMRCQASTPQIDTPILKCTWARTGQLGRGFPILTGKYCTLPKALQFNVHERCSCTARQRQQSSASFSCIPRQAQHAQALPHVYLQKA